MREESVAGVRMNNQAETTIPFCELLKNFVNNYLIFTHLCGSRKRGRMFNNDKKAQNYIRFSQIIYRLLKILTIHLDIHINHPNFK